MAALNEIALNPSTADFVRELMWEWILRNGDRQVRLSFWIIRKSFKLRELHSVFALLLGPPPARLVR